MEHIWAGFGKVGSTAKKIGANYEQLLRAVFSCFRGDFFFNVFKNIVVSALKSCIISL